MFPVPLFEFLTLVLGFYMAWNIGANDVANAMGTSVGSKALTLGKAVCIAAVLEFSGAFLAGAKVSKTIQQGVVLPEVFATDPAVFILGMFSVLLSTGLLLQIASYFALPVSTTHAIVGSLAGFGFFVGGVDAIHWSELGWIVMSWVLSPVCSGVVSYTLFRFIHKTILGSEYAPVLGNSRLKTSENTFAYLQIMSASLVAFAHGANDVSNAVGPVSAIFSVLQEGITKHVVPIPLWLLAFGGVGMVAGLATWGWRVIETIGKKITELTPSRGFAAEFGTAFTVLGASQLGLPISTTHALVGAVVGVGLVGGSHAINLGLFRGILLSWVITLPLCAIGSICVFSILQCVLL